MNTTMHAELSALCREHPELKIEFHHQNWETDFLRFFRSQVNYNVRRESSHLTASVYKGQRSCSFSIEDPDMAAVREKLSETLAIIDQLPPDPDFVDLEDDLRTVPQFEYVNNIDAVPLATKVNILARLASAVEPMGFRIYGTFICNHSHDRVINSNGVDKSMAHSPVMLEVKAVSDSNEVTVLQSYGGESLDRFDEEEFTRQLVGKVQAATREVVDVDPGEYQVILSPRCLAEFLQYLSWLMSARALDQNISPFEGKVGKKLFSEHVTVRDNPHHPGLIRCLYNSEGHLYQSLDIIENGVFRNFLVDNYYAHKTGLTKNGNVGMCLEFEPGDTSLDDMIAGVKRGLYVSSLHYMNFMNPRETSVTGLTRDGTFLIKDGKLTRVVNNLRYTQRITEVLERIVCVEDTSVVVPFSTNYDNFAILTAGMPHVLVDGFKISSSTRTV
ncbi:MAG: TldD/PmbA family protein [Candidatus Cloacimonetes bacterium]|nr:TldD/PmbA family protein [Candidatus Cloacimonadota bacterium]